ncbi:MAG: 1-deoxy-D-xylulose-5-phosphate reductoisomerase [Firmicutes bacterium]|nr:1-deoxy-D-xylulose-5-phosphate reductoisomerase [Alicyclobacillaceae bacterium]MCL6496808.1 1-deoxy-D-xylulose-5-phosphate reductoisomerase [Bacillota bacterium]
MSQPISVIILGATGSVGRTAADVLSELGPDKARVDGLVAHRQVDALWALGRKLGARWVGVTDPEAGRRLFDREGGGRPAVLVGWEAIVAQGIGEAPPGTKVVGAITGFAGLWPTLRALERGLDVLLANKETLVAAGELVTATARRSGSRLVPVDSEHSALLQCLGLAQPFRRLILTCSGGPFRGWSRKALERVTPAMALAHPNWRMGPKITVDSATLMNKGLEVIEAHWLFGVPYDQIAVVIHPQSIVHSMVEFVDGAVMAQLGWPDMRLPVQVALSWPERWPLEGPSLDLVGRQLTFEAVDEGTFPALSLARQAGEAGGLYPAALNAANEEAVAAFLDGRLGFLAMEGVVRAVLDRPWPTGPVETLEQVVAVDAEARAVARAAMARWEAGTPPVG